MENIKLVIEYDGSDFVGWQVQPTGPSVQGALERALGEILQEPIATVAAGLYRRRRACPRTGGVI